MLCIQHKYSIISVQEEDRKLLVGFLEDVMTTLSLSHAPLDSLKAAFVELGWDLHTLTYIHTLPTMDYHSTLTKCGPLFFSIFFFFKLPRGDLQTWPMSTYQRGNLQYNSLWWTQIDTKFFSWMII